jgi:hypothetical protein
MGRRAVIEAHNEAERLVLRYAALVVPFDPGTERELRTHVLKQAKKHPDFEHLVSLCYMGANPEASTEARRILGSLELELELAPTTKPEKKNGK